MSCELKELRKSKFSNKNQGKLGSKRETKILNFSSPAHFFSEDGTKFWLLKMITLGFRILQKSMLFLCESSRLFFLLIIPLFPLTFARLSLHALLKKTIPFSQVILLLRKLRIMFGLFILKRVRDLMVFLDVSTKVIGV